MMNKRMTSISILSSFFGIYVSISRTEWGTEEVASADVAHYAALVGKHAVREAGFHAENPLHKPIFWKSVVISWKQSLRTIALAL